MIVVWRGRELVGGYGYREGALYWHQFDKIDIDFQSEYDESDYFGTNAQRHIVRRWVKIGVWDGPQPEGWLVRLYNGNTIIDCDEFPVEIEAVRTASIWW